MCMTVAKNAARENDRTSATLTALQRRREINPGRQLTHEFANGTVSLSLLHYVESCRFSDRGQIPCQVEYSGHSTRTLEKPIRVVACPAPPGMVTA